MLMALGAVAGLFGNVMKINLNVVGFLDIICVLFFCYEPTGDHEMNTMILFCLDYIQECHIINPSSRGCRSLLSHPS